MESTINMYFRNNKKIRKRCRGILLIAAGFFSVVLLLFCYIEVRDSIPDKLYLHRGESESLEEIFENPLITWEESIPVSNGKKYTISCRFLHIIPLKNVQVQEIDSRQIYVSGDAVGIYMETDGVLIVDTEEIRGIDGVNYDPAENLVQPGDYITAFNQTPVESKRDLIQAVQECNGNPVCLSVIRNGEEIQLSLSPVQCDSSNYKLGIWVRDDTQGIGTLTYVEENGQFGALGHGISDIDTGEILDIKNGELYETEILGIHKGSKGVPGELSGLIRYEKNNLYGVISRNTVNGIFGTVNETEPLHLRQVEVGFKQEIEPGEASVLCSLDGTVEEYRVEISKIDYNHPDSNKSFVIEVTDERLLQKTNGIVQGMSGSPILQNGKVVGAVTHVFVNDPTKGYGIFIETMLDQ